MRLRRMSSVVAALLLVLVLTGTAQAITFGEADRNRHPEVGALLADWNPDSPGPDQLCTGTLIARKVFLTAAHCFEPVDSLGLSRVWVTFARAYDDDSTGTSGLFTGRYVVHPQFGGGANDTHDLAVVLLDSAPGVTPARLPRAGLLGDLKANHTLTSRTFTTVGYGVSRDIKQAGPNALYHDGVRKVTTQHALTLRKAWLLLSMQPSTGNGGTCFGDSGGPHFLGGMRSHLVVSTTISGDSVCRATDNTYRLDTPGARAFLGRFVPLP